jgi:cytochrome c-type biogenesis protein CcmI
MLIVAVIVLVAIALVLPLLVRPSALPEPEVPSPTQHLEDKRDTIYENLRDLQGEYLMGKLSDEDYQLSKRELQRELAEVMAEIDRVLHGEPAADRVEQAEAS